MDDTSRKSLNQWQHVKATADELVQGGLSAGAEFRLRITTSSMTPTLRPGDTVIVRRREWRALRSGDIVLCNVGGVFLAHRLVALKAQRARGVLITKGDRAWTLDAPNEVSAYLGVVVRVEREGRARALDGTAQRMQARARVLWSLMQVALYPVLRRLKRLLRSAALLVLLALSVSQVLAAVTIASFSAQGGQNQIRVNWTTATELKNFGFNLERSSDQSNWTKIAFVQSQSPCITSLTTLSYSYTDANLPTATTYYYRLQLIGKPCGDQDEIYEKVVSATTNGAAPTPSLTATSAPAPSATATATLSATPTATSTPAPTSTATPPSPTPTQTPTQPQPPTRSAPSATPTRASATSTRVPATHTATAAHSATATSSPTATITPTPFRAIENAPPASLVTRSAPAPSQPDTSRPAPPISAPGNSVMMPILFAAMLGAGSFGLLCLMLAGFLVWRHYLRR